MKEFINDEHQHVLSGMLTEEVLSGSPVSIKVARKAEVGPIAARYPNLGKEEFVLETIEKEATIAPTHLVVVLDGSESLNEHLGQIADRLAHIPENVSASLIIASDKPGASLEPIKLPEGLAQIKNRTFSGGEDNLKAVVKAAGIASETKRGAVLWIHGPQPS